MVKNKKSSITISKLRRILSHGSGINADWYVEDKGTYFRASNSFQCMNDMGFYVGWQDFSLIIPKKKPRDFKLHFHGSQYLARRYMLRDYLEDIFDDDMRTLLKK